MTNLTPQQQQEITERLAHFMGWEKINTPVGSKWFELWYAGEEPVFACTTWSSKWKLAVWNPTEDWNHWRMVEEKVMKDEDLWNAFEERMGVRSQDKGIVICSADLPTRCLALIAALDSLKEDD